MKPIYTPKGAAKEYGDYEIAGSVLIDISPDAVCISDTVFPLEVCNCCGNKESK